MPMIGSLGVAQQKRIFKPKTPAGLPAIAQLVWEFDVARAGYAQAVVTILRAGTTEKVPLFFDPQMTEQADNPQVLLKLVGADGRTAGRFARSVYTPYSYQADVDTSFQSGVQGMPIQSLGGQDASLALALRRGGRLMRSLEKHLAQIIYAADFGDLNDRSPIVNTDTITQALGYAAAQKGGAVVLPAGTFPWLGATVPEGVVLVGQGRNATILTSREAKRLVTIGGDRAGLAMLTLDGIDRIPDSTGIYALNRAQLVLADVLVQRIDTGMLCQGGTSHRYRDFFIDTATRGVRLLGDTNTLAAGGGGEFLDLRWDGGEVTNTFALGAELTQVDAPVRNNRIWNVDFNNNIGADGALLISGAMHTDLGFCAFSANTHNWFVEDNTDTALSQPATIGLTIHHTRILNGKCAFDGLCQDVLLDQLDLDGAVFEMNVPTELVVLRDSFENGTSITGQTSNLVRQRSQDKGKVTGVTTTGTALAVIPLSMGAGEVLSVRFRATAEQWNGTDSANFVVEHSCTLSATRMNFDQQTQNFTIGNMVKGLTSGATGIIRAQNDGGATGWIDLVDVAGVFIDRELLTEVSSTGNGRMNGPLVPGTASLIGTKADVAVQKTGGATAWACAMTVLNQQAYIAVQGEAGKTIKWTIEVDVLSD